MGKYSENWEMPDVVNYNGEKHHLKVSAKMKRFLRKTKKEAEDLAEIGCCPRLLTAEEIEKGKEALKQYKLL